MRGFSFGLNVRFPDRNLAVPISGEVSKMRIKPTSKIAGTAFLALLASSAFHTSGYADVLTGPGVYPAPGGTTFVGSGVSPDVGVKTGTYTFLDPTQYNQLWWGPANVLGSMNGNSNDFLTSVTASGLTATWTGSTFVNGAFYTGSVKTEFVATIVSGAAGWITPSSVGISGGPLEVAQMTSNSFVVNEQFLASKDNGASWQTFSGLFNSVNAGNGNNNLDLTGFNGEFFYTSPIAAATPEASTWAMMILGFAGIGFTAYRKRNRSSQLFRLV
jgi:hypothetical protein